MTYSKYITPVTNSCIHLLLPPPTTPIPVDLDIRFINLPNDGVSYNLRPITISINNTKIGYSLQEGSMEDLRCNSMRQIPCVMWDNEIISGELVSGKNSYGKSNLTYTLERFGNSRYPDGLTFDEDSLELSHLPYSNCSKIYYIDFITSVRSNRNGMISVQNHSQPITLHISSWVGNCSDWYQDASECKGCLPLFVLHNNKGNNTECLLPPHIPAYLQTLQFLSILVVLVVIVILTIFRVMPITILENMFDHYQTYIWLILLRIDITVDFFRIAKRLEFSMLGVRSIWYPFR